MRRHLTYANVISSICLFVVLGGSAYAAKVITGKQIKNNSLTSADIRNGTLAPSYRLPPQRKLARRLDIDFTTVARGYVEAQKRGLIESRVGHGTFVRASAKRRHGPMARRPEIAHRPHVPDDAHSVAEGSDAESGHDTKSHCSFRRAQGSRQRRSWSTRP